MVSTGALPYRRGNGAGGYCATMTRFCGCYRGDAICRGQASLASAPPTDNLTTGGTRSPDREAARDA